MPSCPPPPPSLSATFWTPEASFTTTIFLLFPFHINNLQALLCSSSDSYMALVSDSTGRNASGDAEHTEEEDASGGRAFDMISLKTHLPQKRKGLSVYFAGKSRSLACMSDAKCVGDLVKPEIPEAKRSKYMDRRSRVLALGSCKATPTGASACSPCVGV